jgi:hypothetical protein
MPRPTNSRSIGLASFGWIALCFAALATADARADEPTQTQLEQRRQKIARMSETERARLKRNFEAFRKLPPEAQERLRHFDRELKADDANSDNLRHTMTNYLDWIDTLSYGERNAIRDETTPDGREKLVRDTLKEQQRREGFMDNRRRSLSSDDLDAMLQVVETEVRNQLIRSSRQLEKIPSEPGLRRHIAILELAFAPQTDDGKPQTPLRRTPELINAMIERIGNPDQQRWAREGGPNERSMKTLGLLIGGVWAEFEREKPGEDELAEFLAGLDTKKQHEVMQFQGEWQDRHLTRLYMEAHPEKYPKMPHFDQWFGFGNFGPRRRGDWGRPNNEGPGKRLRGKNEGSENPPARPMDRMKKSQNDPPAT